MKGGSATKILLETLLLVAHKTVDQGVVASQRYGRKRQAGDQIHEVVTQGRRWEIQSAEASFQDSQRLEPALL